MSLMKKCRRSILKGMQGDNCKGNGMKRTIVLDLDGVAWGGEASGRNPENNKIIFVADGIPGERVEVEIEEETSRWERGRLLRILESSPDRVEAPCPYFGPPNPIEMPDGSSLTPERGQGCAGCRWQHIDYERQLALKRSLVVEQLGRLGRPGSSERHSFEIAERLVEEVVALGDPNQPDSVYEFGFATQMRFAFDERGHFALPGRGQDLQPVDFCLLHHPQLAHLFDSIHFEESGEKGRPFPYAGAVLGVGGTSETVNDGEEAAIVVESSRGSTPSIELDLPVNVLHLSRRGKEEDLSLLVGDWSFPARIGADILRAYLPVGERFYLSPHALGAEVLAAIVSDLLELRPFDHLLDLWAGVGSLSIQLARDVATLVAADDDRFALAGLEANLGSVDNASVRNGSAEQILRRLRRGDYQIDAALVSPPPEELLDPLWERFEKLGVKRIAVIEENSARLARTLEHASRSRYTLTRVQPVDLHPHQELVTLVARFDRSL